MAGSLQADGKALVNAKRIEPTWHVEGTTRSSMWLKSQAGEKQWKNQLCLRDPDGTLKSLN